MSKVIYYVAMSLDGYIATPDGGVDWLAPFNEAGEDYGYSEFIKSIDAILMGSKTFEQTQGFGAWPYQDKPSWVFSKRSFPEVPSGVLVTSKSPVQILTELESQGIERSWLVGGSELASSFATEGFLSELIVSIIPILLGDGIRLFHTFDSISNLKLLDITTFKNGIVQAHYLV